MIESGRTQQFCSLWHFFHYQSFQEERQLGLFHWGARERKRKQITDKELSDPINDKHRCSTISWEGAKEGRKAGVGKEEGEGGRRE